MVEGCKDQVTADNRAGAGVTVEFVEAPHLLWDGGSYVLQFGFG